MLHIDTSHHFCCMIFIHKFKHLAHAWIPVLVGIWAGFAFFPLSFQYKEKMITCY
jgi:hypothetical protein